MNVPKHTLVSLSDDEEMVHDAHDADNVQPSEYVSSLRIRAWQLEK